MKWWRKTILTFFRNFKIAFKRMLRMSRKEDDRVLLTHKWNSEKKGNKQFERGERSYGQQWQWGENKEKEKKEDSENMCGRFELWLQSFSPTTTYRVIFNSPPCLVPKCAQEGWDSIDFHDTHFIQWAKYFPCVTNLISLKCAHSWWVSINCHDTNTFCISIGLSTRKFKLILWKKSAFKTRERLMFKMF